MSLSGDRQSLKSPKFFLLAACVFILAAPQARAWTDDPVDNTKPIRAVHVTELRAQIDAKRLAAKATGGLCAGIAPVPYLWTDNPLISGSTVIRAIHFKEMRDAIQEVYDKAAQPYPAGNVIFPPNPDPFAAPGGVIRAKHVNDLRTAVTSAPTCSPLPPVCGNGSVEAGEACDAGPANGPCPAACSAGCTINACVSCPNGTCGPGENKCNCPSDCVSDVCGDGCCTGSENFAGCPGDCPTCGNDVCDPGETICNCPADIGKAGACSAEFCGNGCCAASLGETPASCPADCGTCNNNAFCEPALGETCANCPGDCGACGGGGESCPDCSCDKFGNGNCGDTCSCIYTNPVTEASCEGRKTCGFFNGGSWSDCVSVAC